MGIRKIARVHTGNREVNELQENVIRSLSPVLDNELVDGVVLTNVSLSTGSNVIAHTLNRTLLGWMVVRQRAQADIWDTQDLNVNAALTLLLSASAPVVVDIYCF